MRKRIRGMGKWARNGGDGENGGDGVRVPPAGNFVSGASEPQNSRLWVMNFADARLLARPAEQPYAGAV